MKILIKPRQSGKSTLIAELMEKDKRSICVQPTEEMKKLFIQRFKILPKERVITFSKYILSAGQYTDRSIYIDEIGCSLAILGMGKVKLATHTNEKEK